MKERPEKTQKNHPAGIDSSDDRTRTRKYFRQLRMRLLAGLLGCFLLPHILLSAYFHYQFTSTLRKSGKFNLAALSESQRNTIDLFLQERVVNIFGLFHDSGFSRSPDREKMAHYLKTLRYASDAFIDVGLLDASGIQVGYAGPFDYLTGRDYSGEAWFKTLAGREKNYFISDIYPGFRNKLHFTIAARQMIDGTSCLIRATLDPDKFYVFLRTMGQGKNVDSALVNGEGLYQVVDPVRGRLLERSDYMPSADSETGVQEVAQADDSVLVAHTWLKETRWALLVRQPLKVAHAQMYRARRILWASLGLILLVVTAVVSFSVKKFTDQAEASAGESRELRLQLLHVSKLASIGQLATGVAHEINNPLAIITATSGVIRDMLDPEFSLSAEPAAIREELSTIDEAAFRARGITRQLLNFGRKNDPCPAPCNVNAILEDVAGGLKRRELSVDDIALLLDLTADLPDTLLDADQAAQVFLNLINNAHDAIEGGGTITVATRRREDEILVTVRDTGAGMTAEQIRQIFNPFFTTKETGRGTGLGLSISLNIVESMGGRIDVQSMPGNGSLFTVSFPILEADNGSDPQEEAGVPKMIRQFQQGDEHGKTGNGYEV